MRRLDIWRRRFNTAVLGLQCGTGSDADDPKVRVGLLTLLFALLSGDVLAARALRWPELIPRTLAERPIAPPPVNHSGLGPDLVQLSPWGDLTFTEMLVAELDGIAVEISGFVVPLGVSDDDRVREFLLVPYFGACVHVPPPPPNQVILVRSTDGLAAERIYDAWTVRGVMKVEATQSAMAAAGYLIDAQEVELYGS